MVLRFRVCSIHGHGNRTRFDTMDVELGADGAPIPRVMPWEGHEPQIHQSSNTGWSWPETGVLPLPFHQVHGHSEQLLLPPQLHPGPALGWELGARLLQWGKQPLPSGSNTRSLLRAGPLKELSPRCADPLRTRLKARPL